MKIEKYAFIVFSLLICFILISCCGEDSPTDNDDDGVEDRGVALESIINTYTEALGIQINQLRLSFIYERQQFDTDELQGEESDSILARIKRSAGERINALGLISLSGNIFKVYPETMDSLYLGKDYSQNEEIRSLLNDPFALYISDVYVEEDSSLNFNYVLPITDFNDGEERMRCILWSNCNLNIIAEYAFAIGQYDSIPNPVFMMENDGRIIYDQYRNKLGAYFSDVDDFGQDNADLCQLMLEETNSHSMLLALDGPGTDGQDGERYIGWKHFNRGAEYWKNGFWVLAITELKSE